MTDFERQDQPEGLTKEELRHKRRQEVDNLLAARRINNSRLIGGILQGRPDRETESLFLGVASQREITEDNIAAHELHLEVPEVPYPFEDPYTGTVAD